ncbi:flagellar hook assembly protein FlgD [Crenobacter sp. SG2303]|uniref:Basal-body rod modification protein FlgD n=1 Tax=Crenobacter oryzisoli TaxID=3056844 RepID=A0ABT7XKG5_9NEIS|nr:flagellar hook assembly protein FlgD [Crenobacter sp. SG2303]MDN0074271.1 flagellar hook assembly protein FlgD [Crenobacter sp. SG2303]
MTIGSVNNNQTSASGTSSTSSASSVLGNTGSASDIQNQFLTLLVTQLKAQDPLNPMDNSQMTSQMAQISTVGGLEKLNTTMGQVLQSQVANQAMMATSLVGHQVMVAGNGLTLGSSGDVQGGVALNSAAAAMQITVTDGNGKVVDTLQVSSPKTGLNNFSWDGADSNGNRLPAGTYTFSAKAVDNAGTSVAATTYGYQNVNAVTWNQGVPLLVTGDGQQHSLGDVVQLS